jgi:hypothetical protein
VADEARRFLVGGRDGDNAGAPKEAKDSAEEVREREMPPTSYRLMHARARLSVAETERLANGLAKTIAVSAAQEEHDQER